MYATWDFVRRHRGKIGAGLAVAGTLYAAKKVVETELVRDCFNEVQSYFDGQRTVEEGPYECIAEARRQFLFDVHQRSCNKTLLKLANEISEKIDAKFDTNELLEKLKRSPDKSAREKIEIWEKLKVHSLSKIVSLIVVFPLVIVVNKAKQSIMCQQLSQQSTRNRIYRRSDSIFARGLDFVKSSLYSPTDEGTNQQSVGAFDQSINSEIFGHLLEYFHKKGIDLLLSVIEKITQQIVAKVRLDEQFGANDALFLIEQIRAKVNSICGENNFVDFVIPTSEINLTNLGPVNNKELRILLQHFADILSTQNCRQLIEMFGSQFLSAVMQIIEQSTPESEGIPFAKLVPVFCNAFSRISIDKTNGSIFYAILNSSELHQFTIFVVNCTNSII